MKGKTAVQRRRSVGLLHNVYV